MNVIEPPAKPASRPSVRLTENQRKVIVDKYLKGDAGPEAWLERVASNIALAELLHAPGTPGWGLFEGVRSVNRENETRPGRATKWALLHEGLATSEERDRNFCAYLKNLSKAAREVPEARDLHAGWVEKFYAMMARFDFLPNSPTLMNAGRDLQQLSACYVLPVPDSMEGIADAVKAQSLIHKAGGGTGFSFQRLRGSGQPVKSTHGVASGAVSFMQIFDKMTDVVKQGGTRRGANMGILPYWHPEILDFIDMKKKPGVMENFNISVTLDENFMRAAERGEDYDLLNPRDMKPLGKKLNAREVFEKMVEGAWASGDPGVIFIDRINNSSSNPTPHLGQIEATNPCFAGHVRLATDRGLVTFEELFIDQADIRVATDNRVPAIRAMQSGGGVAVRTELETGVTVRPAVPVFKTRRNWPVFRLETEHGYEVTATEDHKFFTPGGLVELKDLKPGDEILLQSGAGIWNREDRLPPFLPDNKFAARVRRGECRPPTVWSEELGRLLGWVVGDGWTSHETPAGRTEPNHTVGLMFGDEEKKVLAPRFQAMIKEWTGLEGTAVERNGTLSLFYKSALHYFLKSLGLNQTDGLKKEVPEAIWHAPRPAVLGFLRALFTADGTVNVSHNIGYGSIRLANSSLELLKQVQLLLLNEGIVSRLYLRRKAGRKLMPDSQRRPKMYAFSDQYELVITRENYSRYLEVVGFLTVSKERKAREYMEGMPEGFRRETFRAKVKIVKSAGQADVYCSTENVTNSLVCNGIVTSNCGEQPLLPNEPCNLGSINLSNFVEGETFQGRMDFNRLGETVATAVRFLDDVIDVNNYPLPEIERLSKGNRRIGLGVMGWAEALVKMGIAFDSDDALAKAREVMGFINGKALETSEALAEERGAFPNWKGSIFDPASPHFRGQDRFPRHCARTTIAPTGTIGLAAGLQGAGIEPFFALAYVRYNAKALEVLKSGGKPDDKDVFFEVNPLFRETARRHNFFGLSEDQLWRKIDANHKSARGLAEVPVEIQRLFVTAHDVSTPFHVKIQAAFQAFTDNAVSKTINMANKATVADVREAYRLAYQEGCKGITIYRDGSKTQQVLNLSSAEKKKTRNAAQGVSSEYYEIRTGHGPLHVHVDFDEEGPFRLFANLSPVGSELGGMTALVGVLLSKYFEQGGDPVRILKHLNSIKGDRPLGFGATRVDSVAHAIAIALREHLKKHGKIESSGEQSKTLELWERAEALYCPDCYSSNVEKASGCHGVVCHDCGHSGCS